jgi:hypothetical protein
VARKTVGDILSGRRWRVAKAYRCGEANPSAKLAEHQAIEIRALAGSLSQRKIAERYGVSRSTVSQIKLGLLWKKTPHGADRLDIEEAGR